MNHVTMIWSGIAAATLLLGVVHLAVWRQDRRQYANLALALAAASLAGISFTELGMMTAQTPQAWGQWVRWCHVPMFIHICAAMAFVRLYLGTGSMPLIWIVVGLRVLILVMNFDGQPNFNFASIDGIERIPFLGDQVIVVSRAVVSPWQWIATLSVLLYVCFFLQATVALVRRGTVEERRKALVVGGGIFLFTLLSSLFTQLVIWRGISLPMLITPPFVLSLAAMAVEMARDSLRARRLAVELRESKNRLELAADATGLGFVGWHLASRELWVTQQFRNLFGIAAEADVTVDELAKRVHPDDLPRVRAALLRSVQAHDLCDVEFRVRQPTGMRWLSLRGNVASAGNKQEEVLRGVLRDVSDRMRAEENAQELRKELAHAGRVTMLGQLASALAHELSQPLGAILRNAEVAELMLGRPSPDLEELREIVADIHRDNRRAADVIERLRALLKRKQMQVQPLAIASLVEDASTLVRADAAARHVSVECEMQDFLPLVSGDRVHLAQVLINLIINGMDAAVSASGSTRRVVVVARQTGRDAVEIAVTDSGAGIADDVLPLVFEPFFTTKAEGMGMGLAVSRTIIEAHGGRLWAENEPAGGASFRLTLPTIQEAAA